MCHEQSQVPLPLSRIHGDIKQLLHHLDFRSRFRRSDLIPLINTFHRRRSRAAPNAITEYRPRETNVLSDYLAGQASAWIRDNPHDPRCLGEPFSTLVDLPYELLLEANAVILGPHVAGKGKGLVVIRYRWLLVCGGITAAMLLLFVALPWPRATLLLRSQLSTSRRQMMPVVGCMPPKFVRRDCLVNSGYSSTVVPTEVDLTGAHYELIRAMTGSVTLPPTRLLRDRLRNLDRRSRH